MSTIGRLLNRSKAKAKQLKEFVVDSGSKVNDYVDQDRRDWQETAEDTAMLSAGRGK